MKIKFGDLTVSQVKEICKSHTLCDVCPLAYEWRGSFRCRVCNNNPDLYWTDEKIDLPDEEVKDDA